MRPPLSILLLRVLMALVWIGNGLFCKVLGWVPRHQQIVAEILGDQYAPTLIQLIGFAEIGMALWILSGLWPRLNVAVQVAVVAAMNILEALLVPELLFWGRLNALFATGFILLIIAGEYYRTRSNRPYVVS